MFYYITLLTGSMIVLLAVVLTYKTICMVLKSISNSSNLVNNNYEPVTIKGNSERRIKKGKLSDAVHDSMTPLQRRNPEAAWNQRKTHPVNPDARRHQNFDWLLHERKSVLIEDSYRVRRRYTPPVPTLEMVSHPFRQKRASWVLEHEASKKD